VWFGKQAGSWVAPLARLFRSRRAWFRGRRPNTSPGAAELGHLGALALKTHQNNDSDRNEECEDIDNVTWNFFLSPKNNPISCYLSLVILDLLGPELCDYSCPYEVA
jgi:hypothetical protein